MAGQLRSIHQDNPMNNQAVSATTQSIAINIGEFEGPFAIQIVWEGGVSLDYDLSLEVSNTSTNWVAFASSTQNITGAADSHLYDIVETGAEFMRVVLTKNTGSGNFSIFVNGKGRV